VHAINRAILSRVVGRRKSRFLAVNDHTSRRRRTRDVDHDDRARRQRDPGDPRPSPAIDLHFEAVDRLSRRRAGIPTRYWHTAHIVDFLAASNRWPTSDGRCGSLVLDRSSVGSLLVPQYSSTHWWKLFITSCV